MSRWVDAEKLDFIMVQGKSEEFVNGMQWVLEQIDNMSSNDVVPISVLEQFATKLESERDDVVESNGIRYPEHNQYIEGWDDCISCFGNLIENLKGSIQ